MKATLTESTRVQAAVYRPKVEIIQKVVAEYYGLTLEATQEHKRKGSSIKARRGIHFLCRELIPKCPLHIIGLLTGNGTAFDHATVSHSYNSLTKEMSFRNRDGELVYPEISEEIGQLRGKVMAAFVAARVEPTVRYCPTCGQPIINGIHKAEATATKTCPNCNRTHEEAGIFCCDACENGL